MPIHWVLGRLDRMWANYRPGIIVALIAIPLVIVVAVWVTRRRRSAGWPAAWAARSAWAEAIMIIGTVPGLVLTLTPTDTANGVNLVPFHDLAILVHIGWQHAALQIVGNLLVLAPLGFGLPMRWRIGPFAVLLVGACASTAIETLQWVFQLGRFSSVDDVFLNAIGALIGALLALPWWRSRIDRLTVTAPPGESADETVHAAAGDNSGAGGAETARSVP
ncbi:MAG TPA: VanZ family protein [Micromonosporaceae bacterium]|nr:VanZ family protein [Micromonosporaceae bacterium]